MTTLDTGTDVDTRSNNKLRLLKECLDEFNSHGETPRSRIGVCNDQSSAKKRNETKRIFDHPTEISFLDFTRMPCLIS
jgi:hypothetical protein